MRVGVIANSQDAEAFAQYSEKNGFSADIVAYSATGDLLRRSTKERWMPLPSHISGRIRASEP